MPCWYTCPRCNGTKVDVEKVIRGQKIEERLITCRVCGGRGEIRR